MTKAEVTAARELAFNSGCGRRSGSTLLVVVAGLIAACGSSDSDVGCWASLALLAGVPAKVVSERLGHSTVSFTLDTYSHVLPGVQAEAANRVAALIFSGR